MGDFSNQIKAQSKRKIKAQKQTSQIWSGFGLFGWSVALPAVLGALLGMWLDNHYPDSRSWTLALLIAGLCIGCWNAAHWVMKEQKNITDEETKDE
jgi:ATP synthase protein I